MSVATSLLTVIVPPTSYRRQGLGGCAPSWNEATSSRLASSSTPLVRYSPPSPVKVAPPWLKIFPHSATVVGASAARGSPPPHGSAVVPPSVSCRCPQAYEVVPGKA